MADSGNAMEITLRDVYEAQLRAAEQVTQLTAQVGQLAARVDERLDSGQQRLDDHENRIRVLEARPAVSGDVETRLRALEQARWKLAGAVVLLSMLASWAEWVLFAHK